MKSYTQPDASNTQPKRLRSDKENIDSTSSLEEPRKKKSFFSEEKENEMILFSKIRTLDTRLKNLRYGWLLGARLTSIDLVLTDRAEDGRLLSRVKSNPALEYLRTIIDRLAEIFLENETHIRTYLMESLNTHTTQNNQHVVFLADIFMKFKANIEETGLLTDQAGVFEDRPYVKMIKQIYDWIAYFHYVIKKAFDKMGATPEDQYTLTQLTSRVQILQGLTYDSLKKNFPEISQKYAELEHKKIFASDIQSFFAAQQQKNTPSPQDTSSQQIKTPTPKKV